VIGLAAAVVVALAAAVALAHAELAVLTPVPRRGLRVLMYHRVDAVPDRSTVTAAQLERQVRWLRSRGFALVRLRDVVRHAAEGAPLPADPVLLTFDDATADAHDALLPVLRRLDAPAAVFAVPGFAGSRRPYEGAERRFASAAELRALDAGGVEVGLHTFEHVDLSARAPGEVGEDVARCARWLAEQGVPFQPALAFPFGAYPRKDPARRAAFLSALRAAGVAVAFRIGNRVNALPLRSPLEVQRTEVRGDEPFWVFAWKVRRGRRKGFAKRTAPRPAERPGEEGPARVAADRCAAQRERRRESPMPMRTHELHPSVVHAPLALLPATALVDLLAAVRPLDRRLDRAGRRLWWITAGGALLVGLTGMAASQEVGPASRRARDVMFLHGIGNFGLVLAAFGVATWRTTHRASMTSAFAGVAASMASMYTAYLGGELVYTHGVGVKSLDASAVEAPALLSSAAPGRLARDAGRGLAWLLSRGRRAAQGRERLDPGALVSAGDRAGEGAPAS
jgi:peptidoglycan/xylan/chitin deacetylase (PgdA/CDA1 family)/uncharacterized membrane protein